jgi:DNA-binding CsgD family transcriptional regulator
MSRGLTKAEAGRVLFIEESTVKSTMKRISRKLGARNVTHAVAIALREGMIR